MLEAILSGPYEAIVSKAVTWRIKNIRKGRIDAWEGCEIQPLFQYRKALDQIANKMSQIDVEVIQSRFNPQTGNIELCRFWSCEVVAEVGFNIEGEEHHAIVRLAPEVHSDFRAYVEDCLPVRVEFAT